MAPGTSRGWSSMPTQIVSVPTLSRGYGSVRPFSTSTRTVAAPAASRLTRVGSPPHRGVQAADREQCAWHLHRQHMIAPGDSSRRSMLPPNEYAGKNVDACLPGRDADAADHRRKRNRDGVRQSKRCAVNGNLPDLLRRGSISPASRNQGSTPPTLERSRSPGLRFGARPPGSAPRMATGPVTALTFCKPMLWSDSPPAIRA